MAFRAQNLRPRYELKTLSIAVMSSPASEAREGDPRLYPIAVPETWMAGRARSRRDQANVLFLFLTRFLILAIAGGDLFLSRGALARRRSVGAGTVPWRGFANPVGGRPRMWAGSRDGFKAP